MFVEANDPEYIQLQEENIRRKIAHEFEQKLRKPLVLSTCITTSLSTSSTSFLDTQEVAPVTPATLLNYKQNKLVMKPKRKLCKKSTVIAKSGYAAFRYDQDLSRKSWEAVHPKPMEVSEPSTSASKD